MSYFRDVVRPLQSRRGSQNDADESPFFSIELSNFLGMSRCFQEQVCRLEARIQRHYDLGSLINFVSHSHFSGMSDSTTLTRKEVDDVVRAILKVKGFGRSRSWEGGIDCGTIYMTGFIYGKQKAYLVLLFKVFENENSVKYIDKTGTVYPRIGSFLESGILPGGSLICMPADGIYTRDEASKQCRLHFTLTKERLRPSRISVKDVFLPGTSPLALGFLSGRFATNFLLRFLNSLQTTHLMNFINTNVDVLCRMIIDELCLNSLPVGLYNNDPGSKIDVIIMMIMEKFRSIFGTSFVNVLSRILGKSSLVSEEENVRTMKLWISLISCVAEKIKEALERRNFESRTIDIEWRDLESELLEWSRERLNNADKERVVLSSMEVAKEVDDFLTNFCSSPLVRDPDSEGAVWENHEEEVDSAIQRGRELLLSVDAYRHVVKKDSVRVHVGPLFETMRKIIAEFKPISRPETIRRNLWKLQLNETRCIFIYHCDTPSREVSILFFWNDVATMERTRSEINSTVD